MKNIFWLIIGAALMYVVIVKGRAILRKLTPQGVAEQVERKGHEAASSFGDFYATYQTARQAREAELRQELNITA